MDIPQGHGAHTMAVKDVEGIDSHGGFNVERDSDGGQRVVDVQGTRAVNLRRGFIDKEVTTLPSSVKDPGVISSLVSPNLGLVHYLGSSFDIPF